MSNPTFEAQSFLLTLEDDPPKDAKVIKLCKVSNIRRNHPKPTCDLSITSRLPTKLESALSRSPDGPLALKTGDRSAGQFSSDDPVLQPMRIHVRLLSGRLASVDSLGWGPSPWAVGHGGPVVSGGIRWHR